MQKICEIYDPLGPPMCFVFCFLTWQNSDSDLKRYELIFYLWDFFFSNKQTDFHDLKISYLYILSRLK